jgi:ADP-heptose:LPS heptosyltransferase
MSLRIAGRARDRIAAILRESKLHTGRWAVIHPGATAASRRYPPEGFAAVTNQLEQIYGWRLVFTGSAGESELVDSIRRNARSNAVSLAGGLDLEEMAALLSEAPLLISNNTGPVHMAAALGTPVVDLYALTNPQHTPWAVPSRVLNVDVSCKYCYKSVCPEGHHDCLRLVTPESVVRAVLDLHRETRNRITAEVA